MAEVVIVGGGISGVCVAWELARRGVREVVLVERDHLAAGPTGRSGAVIRCHYSTPELVRLALEGRRFFQNALDLVGDDCGFQPVGFLAAVPSNGVEALEAKLAMQRAAGLDVSLVRGPDLREIEPALDSPELAAAAWEPDSGHADPVRATWAIARRAAELGVEIRQGCAVREIRVSGGRVRSVVTADGEIPAGAVICAAGPWTRRLIAAVGPDLPTTILRNAMALFLRPPALARPHPVLIDYAHRFYARPDGRYSLTGSVDEAENQLVADPDDYDSGVHVEEIAAFRRRLGQAFNALRGASDRGGWVGLYDVTPDWLHLLDEVPGANGLWILCGTSGHGFKLAPAIARVMADLLLNGREPPVEAAQFGLERLADARPPPGYGVLS
ncbi:MAG TPA: FAD-binding oxidoreductase [Kofleriaceae bacterium]|nr:FAD-binding oxidoreductase [Kofleriaceae bacterium]